MIKIVTIRSPRIVNQEQCDAFIHEIESALAQSATHIILDCSHCLYINSRALGAILHAMATLTARGGNLRVVRPQGMVRQCMETMGMLSLVEIYETVDEAMQGA